MAMEARIGIIESHLIIPFFLEDGRYPIDDIHYVANLLNDKSQADAIQRMAQAAADSCQSD